MLSWSAYELCSALVQPVLQWAFRLSGNGLSPLACSESMFRIDSHLRRNRWAIDPGCVTMSPTGDARARRVQRQRRTACEAEPELVPCSVRGSDRRFVQLSFLLGVQQGVLFRSGRLEPAAAGPRERPATVSGGGNPGGALPEPAHPWTSGDATCPDPARSPVPDCRHVGDVLPGHPD